MLVYRKRSTERTFFERPEGMPRLLHALLIERGIASAAEAEAFLHPGEDTLRPPELLSCMDAAAARLRAALKNGERVCVYGDYDVDGVCAAAILYLHLSALGARVKTYLPDRHAEGYGLNESAVRALAADTDLLVTVDCGVNACELAALSKSLGMDVIITDHHRPGEALPDCPVVNPLLNGYPCPHLSGAGVAFKLTEALSGRAAALEYVDLAALSTVADVVPLLDENRALVRLGLARLNERPRPGIRALREIAGLGEKTLTAGHLGFQLGPRLNAGGRLGSARRALDLLLSDDDARAGALARELEAENAERRRVETAILADAEELLRDFDFPAHRAIVLVKPGWNTGVLGLAASRLAEKYHYPVILMAEEDGVLKGSCRSIEGVDIFAALSAVKSLLTRFGGHRQAAGLALETANLEAFRAALEKTLRETVPARAYVPCAEYDLRVALRDLDAASVAALEALQPTGMGNPAPVLRCRARVRDVRRIGREGAHLRLTAEAEDAALAGVMFSAGARADALAGEYDLLFAPKINVWMGRAGVELELRALEPPDARGRISANLARRENLVIRFLTEMLYNKETEAAKAPALSVRELRRIFDGAPQGTLAVARDFNQAAFLLDALCDMTGEENAGNGSVRPADAAIASALRFDVEIGAYPSDPRAFNAVSVLAPGAPPARYRRVIPAGAVVGVPPPDWLKDLPDVDGLRDAYRVLRALSRRPLFSADFPALCRVAAGESDLSPIGMAAALLALRDMRLLDYDDDGRRLRLLPARKCDPLESNVVRRILRLRAEGREGNGCEQ